MIDAIQIGVALLAAWMQYLWQALNFWQQIALFVSLLLILWWCVRKLSHAFVDWFHKRKQHRRMAATVADASNDDQVFGEFYLALWQASGLDYERDEAERLYDVSKTNSELANHMADVWLSSP